jgi:hypothetical protein
MDVRNHRGNRSAVTGGRRLMPETAWHHGNEVFSDLTALLECFDDFLSCVELTTNGHVLSPPPGVASRAMRTDSPRRASNRADNPRDPRLVEPTIRVIRVPLSRQSA